MKRLRRIVWNGLAVASALAFTLTAITSLCLVWNVDTSISSYSISAYSDADIDIAIHKASEPPRFITTLNAWTWMCRTKNREHSLV